MVKPGLGGQLSTGESYGSLVDTTHSTTRNECDEVVYYEQLATTFTPMEMDQTAFAGC